MKQVFAYGVCEVDAGLLPKPKDSSDDDSDSSSNIFLKRTTVLQSKT